MILQGSIFYEYDNKTAITIAFLKSIRIPSEDTWVMGSLEYKEQINNIKNLRSKLSLNPNNMEHIQKP